MPDKNTTFIAFTSLQVHIPTHEISAFVSLWENITMCLKEVVCNATVYDPIHNDRRLAFFHNEEPMVKAQIELQGQGDHSVYP